MRLSDNLRVGRLSAELRIPVPGRTAAEVSAQLQEATGLRSGLRQQLMVRQRGDGSFVLHIPQDRSSSNPVLRARVEDDGGAAVLRGVARESRGGRFVDGLFTFLALFMAAVAVIAVVTRVWPGVAVCGGGAVAFLGVRLLGSRLRRPVFGAGVQQLQWAIGRVLQIEPLTPVAGLHTDDRTDPDLERELSAAMLALAERVDAGATDAECLTEVQNLAGLFRRSVPGDFVSVAQARTMATTMLQEYRNTDAAERAQIRARLQSGDLSQSP